MKVRKLGPRNYEFRLAFTYDLEKVKYNFVKVSFFRTENGGFCTLRAMNRILTFGPLLNCRNMKKAVTLGIR